MLLLEQRLRHLLEPTIAVCKDYTGKSCDHTQATNDVVLTPTNTPAVQVLHMRMCQAYVQYLHLSLSLHTLVGVYTD